MAEGLTELTAKILSRKDTSEHSATFADVYDDIQKSIAHQLQHGVFERLDTNFLHGPVAHPPAISGAIFLSLHPRQLPILIADARTSIVLAVQRHLDNEQYRKRLVREFHYRALKPHLSDSFRLLMVPPSNSHRYQFAARRKPNLALAYEKEVDRLEASLLPQHKLVDVVHGSCVRMRSYNP